MDCPGDDKAGDQLPFVARRMAFAGPWGAVLQALVAKVRGTGLSGRRTRSAWVVVEAGAGYWVHGIGCSVGFETVDGTDFQDADWILDVVGYWAVAFVDNFQVVD